MKNLLGIGMRLITISLSINGFAQSPVANFSLSLNSVCSGSTNVVQITDLSTNAPNSWSYTLNPGGPGPGGPNISTIQNPTVSYNQPGTFTITLIATNSSGSSSPVTKTITVLPSPNAQINPNNQNTCVGGNPSTIAVLTGGPGSGSNTYNWSTGSTTSSISVSPTITTTYSCIITNTNGCSTERTATITIGQPTISITSIPASICPGSSCTMIATGQGPGPSSYTWSTGATTRSISTNVAGVYTASYTNSNGCSATFSYNLGTSTTLSLTAHADPSVVCLGNSAHLSVIGATSYTWSTGVTAATDTVTPTSNTNYTVFGQLGTCSGVTTLAVNVSLSPTVTISGNPTSICAGASVTLNAAGATTYTWVQIGSNSQSISVSPTSNTTYTVRGTNQGCTPKTASISINVFPNPLISVNSNTSVVCAGEIVALAASGANSYSWSSGGTSAIIIVTPSTTTTYTVTGTNQNNCIGKATITQSVNACLGISSLNTSNITLEIYPNPSFGNFSVRSDVNQTLSVFNETGRCVRTISLNEDNGRNLSVSDLEGGMYFIGGSNLNGKIKQKIIVLK